MADNSRHDWNGWDHYLSIHEKRLRDFDHFISSDELIYTPTPTLVLWEGVLFCVNGLEIKVTKKQEVRTRGGRMEVMTFDYSYHVMRRTEEGVINLFRYDNIHQHPHHPDHHHRHRFDELGNEIEPTEHIGEGRWPTLSDVIREAEELSTKLG